MSRRSKRLEREQNVRDLVAMAEFLEKGIQDGSLVEAVRAIGRLYSQPCAYCRRVHR
jgi:hypothetical protein